MLHRNKRILGIRCTVVRDTVSDTGGPVERTFDWYAQDKQGNVWYMGENSLERSTGAREGERLLEVGRRRGAAGHHHARPPPPGDAYRQEYYPPGEALDEARVLRLDGSVNVPTARSTRCW